MLCFLVYNKLRHPKMFGHGNHWMFIELVLINKISKLSWKYLHGKLFQINCYNIFFQNGAFSMLPYLTMWLFIGIAGTLSDLLIVKKILPYAWVRKLMSCIGKLSLITSVGYCFICFVYSKDNVIYYGWFDMFLVFIYHCQSFPW